MLNRMISLGIVVAAVHAFAAPSDSLPARAADGDRASKNGKLSADLGGTKIVVTYGRPQVKGRKVWGGLIKGGEVWRAGADEATVVAFDSPVLVEGQKLPAGAYAFFVKPGKDPAKDQWAIIFNKTVKQWGAYSYDSKQDALVVKVTPKAAEMTEALMYEIQGSALVLRFENLAVPVQVTKT